jgi:hypothetical protein
MSEHIEKTFNVSGPARLQLSNIRGSVEIRPGEDGVICVSAVKDSGRGDASRTEIEMIQEADGAVKVSTRFPDAAFGWLIGSFPCPVEYVVTAPRQCSLRISGVSNSASAEGFEGEFSFNTVSGAIDLRQLKGPVKASSVSGAMELEAVSGEMRLNTVSGRIKGERLSGPLHVDTVSGRVELAESSIASADATAVSAGMDLETALSEGPYRFKSVSGEVTLRVPEETHCSAELHTVSGSLRLGLPATSQSRGHGAQTAEVQGGGVKVYLGSVSGDLSIEK